MKRTAAYARVSSGKDAMLHSLSSQVSYYNQLIQSNPEWLFCGVYADEALTGTKGNRAEFQKLLNRCRQGEIDLILTKSISRFARNTVTLLETVRELKSLGVDVYFEEQRIHSMSSDGELLLSILASYAQEESYSASENRKWQIRKDFSIGKIGSITILGYRRNAEGVLEIEPNEAELVRMIFSDYICTFALTIVIGIIMKTDDNIRILNAWNEDSVSLLYANYYRSLVIYASQYIHDDAEAEDLVQEIFTSFWERKLTFKSESQLSYYLFLSVRNAAISFHRHTVAHEKYVCETMEQNDVLSQENDSEFNKEEIYRQLMLKIDELPKRQREIFLLSMQGKKNKEIADQLHISYETVKVLKKRGMRTLRAKLSPSAFAIIEILALS